jgi:hypothetical protein
MSQQVMSSEEAFARIVYEIEEFAFPIYHDMTKAIIAFARGQKSACARHVASMEVQMRIVLGTYFNNLHDKIILKSVWLSHIQGFYAWETGYYDEEADAWKSFDGLSGNQVLLFQALDAFLGIEQYLTPLDQERNVPKRQRKLCEALRKYSFRGTVSMMSDDENEVDIVRSFNGILKQLKVIFCHSVIIQFTDY